MAKTKKIIQLLAFAAFFAFLFHRQSIGLNLFIFDFTLLIWLFSGKQTRPQSPLSILLFAAVAITATTVLLVHSALSIFVNILLMLMLTGWIGVRNTNSALFIGLSAVQNFFLSHLHFLQTIYTALFSKTATGKPVILFRKIIFVILGLVIIMIFMGIYSSANPWFDERVGGILSNLGDFIDRLTSHIDEVFMGLFILGTFIGILFLFHHQADFLAQFEAKLKQHVELDRSEDKMADNRWMARVAVGMLVVLNFLLLWVNWIDLLNVWLYFEWQGEYLKQFVHEGTYMLLFSVGLSIVLVVVIFHQPSTIFQQNKTLKVLTYSWLAQNVFLVLSVGMRNYWYMSYFALAYKRIAVVFFLLLVLYGLYSVITKVSKMRSLSYLIKVNANAVLVVLTMAALPNWDAMIARYNLSHYQHSFVHLDFLSDLSDKTLPILDVSKEKLTEIELAQRQLFFFEDSFMSADAYFSTISERKKAFEAAWPLKGILSWNYAEARAYKRLTANK